MGNTPSSTRTLPSPTPTPTGFSSWRMSTDAVSVQSRPYPTAGVNTYTSIIPIYTTDSYVDEICRHGIGDETTRTCLTTTKTVTDLLSFSESIYQQTISLPPPPPPPLHTSAVSSVPYCPDYPHCSSLSFRPSGGGTGAGTGIGTGTRPPPRPSASFPYSISASAFPRPTGNISAISVSLTLSRTLSTRRSSASYSLTSTLWDNSSTSPFPPFPWLPTTASASRPFFTSLSPNLSLSTSETLTEIPPEFTTPLPTLTLTTSFITDTDTCSYWWCDTTTSTSSSSRRRSSRTRTRSTTTTRSHTRLNTYTYDPPTLTTDTYGSDETTVLSDPFPWDPTVTSDPDADDCDIFNWWSCPEPTSTSTSSSRRHRTTHSRTRTRFTITSSSDTSCGWWDYYCSITESPPFSTELAGTSTTEDCETTSSSRHRHTRPSTITWVPEPTVSIDDPTDSDYFSLISTAVGAGGSDGDDDPDGDDGSDDGDDDDGDLDGDGDRGDDGDDGDGSGDDNGDEDGDGKGDGNGDGGMFYYH